MKFLLKKQLSFKKKIKNQYFSTNKTVALLLHFSICCFKLVHGFVSQKEQVGHWIFVIYSPQVPWGAIPVPHSSRAQECRGHNHIYSGNFFGGIAAFPLFSLFFSPLSEALLMDPSPPCSLLCWKSQSGGEWEVQQEKAGFSNKSQISCSMCRAPRRSGSGCPLQAELGTRILCKNHPNFTAWFFKMDLIYPRERQLAQELMGKKKNGFGNR